jgi:hypothetical protein
MCENIRLGNLPFKTNTIEARCLKDLRLSTVRNIYEGEAIQARHNNYGYEPYRLALMEKEDDTRKQNPIARFLQESVLPLNKSFESFDLNRLSQK